MPLTAPDDQTAFLYRWVVLLKSTKTHRPLKPHSHQGPGSSAACTVGNDQKNTCFRLKSELTDQNKKKSQGIKRKQLVCKRAVQSIKYSGSENIGTMGIIVNQ